MTARASGGPTTACSRPSARLRADHRARSGRCAPPAAEAWRWADEMHRLLALLIAALISLPMVSLAESQAAKPSDASILRTALAGFCTPDHDGFYVLSADSLALSEEYMHGPVTEHSSEADSLRERNGQSLKLPTLPDCPGLRVVAEADIQAALKAGGPLLYPLRDPPMPGWEGFYSRYPGSQGVVRVTVPGVSSDGSRAIVAGSVIAGGLAGSGFAIQVTKVNGKWTITNRHTLWIS